LDSIATATTSDPFTKDGRNKQWEHFYQSCTLTAKHTAFSHIISRERFFSFTKTNLAKLVSFRTVWRFGINARCLKIIAHENDFPLPPRFPNSPFLVFVHDSNSHVSQKQTTIIITRR